MAALSRTIKAITPASENSFMPTLSAAAPSNIQFSGLPNWEKKIFRGPAPSFSGRALGPYSARRRAASSGLSP